MEIIGLVVLGEDTYRVLGGTWLGCTVTGNAVNLGAHLWQGGRVSAVGTEGKASAGITLADGTEYDADPNTTYAVVEKVVIIQGHMSPRGSSLDGPKLPFRMSIRYIRTDPDSRSYQELLGAASDEIDHDWLDADGRPSPDTPNP